MVLWAVAAMVEAVLWYVFIWWLRYRMLRGMVGQLNTMVGRIEELLAMIEDLEKRAAMAAHNLAVAAEQKAENIP